MVNPKPCDNRYDNRLNFVHRLFINYIWPYGLKPGVDDNLTYIKNVCAVRFKVGDETYENFESKIRECEKGECPYTSKQLQKWVNEIYPTLTSVSTVQDMCDSVTNK